MIFMNRDAVLIPKIYKAIIAGTEKEVQEWMKEVCLIDNSDWINEPDLKEQGRKLIQEILPETCILFLEGIKEECELHIEDHRWNLNV